MHGGLTSRIATPNHVDVFICTKRSLARPGPVIHPRPKELFLPRESEPPVFDAGCANRGPGDDLGTIGAVSDSFACDNLASHALPPKQNLGAETAGLMPSAIGQVSTADSIGK